MLTRSLLRVSILILPLLDAGCSPEQASIAGLVQQHWTDAQGNPVTLGPSMGAKATVFVTLDPDCPYCQFYAQDLQHVAEQYASDSVKLIGVYAGPYMEAAAASKFAKQAGLTFPQLMDPGCSLCSALHARVTPESFITDAQGTVVYRGAIDDRAVSQGQTKYTAQEHYLTDALSAFLKDGKPQPEVTAVGCIVEYKE
ncbi:MAG: redoxin domain-containing protein [Flavobacteriales bacterium]